MAQSPDPSAHPSQRSVAMPDYMSNYDLVCGYVYERVFVRFPDYNKVTRGAVQGLAQALAIAETISRMTS